jgi:thiol-disulfide isomerase/thioredoxin
MMTLSLLALSAPLAAPLSALPTTQETAAWPSLSAHGDTLLATWLEQEPAKRRKGEPTWAVRFASLDGTWSEPVTLAAGPDVLGNWADRPAAVAGGDGALYAHWLQKLEGGPYAYGVQVTRSTDGGTTWNDLGWLHDDTSPVEHGFVSMVPVAGGVEAFWLDGRAMIDDGPTALRTAVVGETVPASTVVDDRTCDCCATGAAVGPEGTVVAWRDRSDTEVRDIELQVNGQPRSGSADGWTINGCPVNGPSVAGTPEGAAVGWFTASDETPRVQVAFVGDDGLEDPILIDGSAPLGRVDLIQLGADEAIVTWLDPEDDVALILARRVTRDRQLGPVVEVGRTDPGRGSGFPQAERLGDDLVWVWTVPGPDKTFTLDSARRPLSDLPVSRQDTVSADAQAPAAPPQRPALQATTLDGEPLDLADYAGRPLLVNIWASWCGPCVTELPHLAALAAEHPDLAIVGVSVDMDGQEDAVRAMVERFTLPYPNVYGDGEPWARALGITNIPVTWLYSPDGVLLWHKIEAFDPSEDAFLEALAAALE